jgi:hypothetical protein
MLDHFRPRVVSQQVSIEILRQFFGASNRIDTIQFPRLIRLYTAGGVAMCAPVTSPAKATADLSKKEV